MIVAGFLLVLAGCVQKQPADLSGVPETYYVFFETNSADLTPDGYAIVQRAADGAAKLRPQTIEISGYSDRVGSEAANKQIAIHRAEIVTKTLTDLGVDPAIVTTLPLGTAIDEYGPTGDRRIEIHLIKVPSEAPGPVLK
jgi:outer membrane protein OmpA-like peptidoglycan-associated protein